jgi:hypothetical protein
MIQISIMKSNIQYILMQRRLYLLVVISNNQNPQRLYVFRAQS